MKKTIIAAAVAAAVAAPAAFADVTVYGKMHYALDSVDKNGTTTDEYNSAASRWGLKGSTDLGNGMSAFFKNEYGMNTIDDAADTRRDAYIGLKGDFGTITAGRMGAPTKGLLYGTGNVQLADSSEGNDFGGAFVSKTHRVNNALAYSNSFNGVNVVAAVTGDTGQTGFSENKSFSVDTTVAGVKVGYASLNYGDTTADVDIVGAKMSMDALTVGVVYEDVDNTEDTTGISLSYKMGNNTLSFSTAETDSKTAGSDETRTRFGIQHSFGKTTSIYAAYAEIDSDTAASDNETTAVGIIHTF